MAYDIVVFALGENPDPNSSIVDSMEVLGDPDCLEKLDLDEDLYGPYVEQAADFVQGYNELPEYHPDYKLDLANGMKQGEAYAYEYNEITDYTSDHDEFMALLRELDEQADPYIMDKTRDMYGFEDNTVVAFSGTYARWGKPEEDSVEQS